MAVKVLKTKEYKKHTHKYYSLKLLIINLFQHKNVKEKTYTEKSTFLPKLKCD